MADTNLTSLYYALESTEGNLPNDAKFIQIDYTGSPGLAGAPTSIQSESIRRDRQIPDLITTGKEISGTINIELATLVNDDMLAGALYNEWVRKGLFFAEDIASVSNDTITFANSDHGFITGDIALIGYSDEGEAPYKVASSSGDSATFTGLAIPSGATSPTAKKVAFDVASDDITIDKTAKTITFPSRAGLVFKYGEWIGVNGASDEDKGFYRFVSMTEDSGNAILVYDNLFSHDSFEDNTTGFIRVLLGDYVTNGVRRQSFSLLQRFESHSPITTYIYKGITFGTMEISLEAQSIVTAAFAVQGLDNQIDDVTRRLANPPVASRLSTGTDVAVMQLSDKDVGVGDNNIVQSATISLNNNLRQQIGVGIIGASSIASGVCQVTGAMSVYFNDSTIYERVINNVASSFTSGFFDNDGKRLIIFDMPRIKFSTGAPDVPAGNQDVLLPLEYQAIISDQGYQLLIQEFYYV